jgi:hypothetical protein
MLPSFPNIPNCLHNVALSFVFRPLYYLSWKHIPWNASTNFCEWIRFSQFSGLLFDREHGSTMFLRNIGGLPPQYTELILEGSTLQSYVISVCSRRNNIYLAYWNRGSRGHGFDSRRYQIFSEVVGLERGPLSLVRITEELLEWKSSGSGSRKPRFTAVGIRCADHATPSIRKSCY